MEQTRTEAVAELLEPGYHPDEGCFLAGQPAPAGLYADVDAPWRRPIRLADGDALPASLDGRVAVYYRLPVLTRIQQANGGAA